MTVTVRMVALKSTRYRGRLYRQGEAFDAPPAVADLYRKLRRALPADAIQQESPAAQPAPVDASRALEAAQESLAIEALRAEFRALTGTAPDGRWGEARLRSAISDARASHAAQGVHADDSPSEMSGLLC